MKVVLLKDVPKLGKKHEVKDVADGFAYNSLIPRGLVVPATHEHVKKAQTQVALKAEKEKGFEDAFRTLIKTSEEEPVVFTAEANDKGHLFKGIRASDIAEALEKRGVALKERDVVLPAPLKEVGTHEIELRAASLSGMLHIVIKKQ